MKVFSNIMNKQSINKSAKLKFYQIGFENEGIKTEGSIIILQ